MIRLILCCLLLLIKYIPSSVASCPKPPPFNGRVTEVTPSNIPFTLVSITLADVVEANTPVDIVSASYQSPNSYVERYVKHDYYVASVKGQDTSFAFGRIDLTNMATFFEGIIFVNGKLNFVEQIQAWRSATAGLAGKSALADKWGMGKWVDERKYIYYTEDDIEPLSNINDTVELPYAHGKRGLVKLWRQKMDIPAEAPKKPESLYQSYYNDKKVCSINVLLDSLAMEKVFKYNIKQAIHEVIILFGSLDFLYRILDFSGAGEPNHFGFQIAKITVIMKSNNYASQNSFPLADKYMELLSTTGLGDDRCLCVSFTCQNLGGVTGQAFLGSAVAGIFMDGKTASPRKANWNIAYVNYMLNPAVQIRTRGSVLITLAHEVGHAFGAIHEEGTRCDTRTHLLMAGYLVDKIEGFHNFQFSQCNIILMKRIIDTRIAKFLNCPHNLRVYDNLFNQKYRG
ncbi:unnamed protein product [Gordionus sp. m RMFG-2023]